MFEIRELYQGEKVFVRSFMIFLKIISDSVNPTQVDGFSFYSYLCKAYCAHRASQPSPIHVITERRGACVSMREFATLTTRRDSIACL